MTALAHPDAETSPFMVPKTEQGHAAPTLSQIMGGAPNGSGVPGGALPPMPVETSNPHAATATGDVKFRGDADPVEPKLLNLHNAVDERYETIHGRWQERIKAEGKATYHCPLCKAKTSQVYTEKDACQTHITTEHPAKVEQMKLTNAPEPMYSPVLVMEAPKRKLTDFYDAPTAKRMEAAVAAQQSVAPILEQLRTSLNRKSSTLSQLNGPSYATIETMPGMETKALQKLMSDAVHRGKNELVRAARKELTKRGVEVSYH